MPVCNNGRGYILMHEPQVWALALGHWAITVSPIKYLMHALVAGELVASWAEPNLHAEKREVGWHHYAQICTTARILQSNQIAAFKYLFTLDCSI